MPIPLAKGIPLPRHRLSASSDRFRLSCVPNTGNPRSRCPLFAGEPTAIQGFPRVGVRLILVSVLLLSGENGAGQPLSPVDQLKQFLSSPKAAVSLEATICAREIVRVNSTNYHEQSTTRIQCFWTPTLLAYSETFEL